MQRGHAPSYVRFWCYRIPYGELFFESDVFVKGGVQQILTDKDFERALREFKRVDGALHNRFIVQFKRWCETYGKVFPEDAYQVIGKF